MRFVLDISVIQRFGKPRGRAAVDELRADHELTVCVPTLLEVGVSARDEADHLRQRRLLTAAMRVLEGSEEVDAAARTIQDRLVAGGRDRWTSWSRHTRHDRLGWVIGDEGPRTLPTGASTATP